MDGYDIEYDEPGPDERYCTGCGNDEADLTFALCKGCKEEMNKIYLEEVSFVTPPENHGQIVIVSYAFITDQIFKRIYDQSDKSTYYERADISWALDDDKWKEFETYQPFNNSPPWELNWVPVDEFGEHLAKTYSFSIYDADPNTCSVDAFSEFNDENVAAESVDVVIKAIEELLKEVAGELNMADGYNVGDILYATIWDSETQVVANLTYQVTAEDLGIEN